MDAPRTLLCGAAMIQEANVKAKVSELLAGSISREDFSRWIVDESWNMHQDSSASAIDLVSDIHLLLAERDDLSLDDDAFLREMSALVREPQFIVIRLNIDG